MSQISSGIQAPPTSPPGNLPSGQPLGDTGKMSGSGRQVQISPEAAGSFHKADGVHGAVRGDYQPVALKDRHVEIPQKSLQPRFTGGGASPSAAQDSPPGIWGEFDRAPLAATRPFIKTLLLEVEGACIDVKTASQTAEAIQTSGRFSEKDRARFVSGLSQKHEACKTLRDGAVRCMSLQVTREEIPHAKKFIQHIDQRLNLEVDAWNAMSQTFDYTEKAEADLTHLAALSNKLQKTGKLTGKEQAQFNQILWAHKENIPILQGYLSGLRENLGEDAGMTKILDAALTSLADKHMALADLMSLHSDHMPDRPALSRNDRLDFHLLETEAGLRMTDNLKNRFSGNKEALRALNDAGQKLTQHAEDLSQLKNKTLLEGSRDLDLLLDMPVMTKGDVSPQVKKELEAGFKRGEALPIARRDMPQSQMINLFLTSKLKNAGIDMKKLPDLKFIQDQAFAEAINHRPWTAINNEIKAEIGSKTSSFRSIITPSAMHSDRLEHSYEGHGVGARDRLQHNHAINLAQTSFVNESGQKLFSAHRSGVLDSYQMTPKNLAQLSDTELGALFQSVLIKRGKSIENPESLVKEFRASSTRARALTKTVRQESSKIMAEDAATTMLLDDPALLSRAMKGEVVDLPITSISLMTPDYLRELGSKAGEQAMLVNHKAGLDSLHNKGRPINLTMRDQAGERQTVRVRVRPRVMNFGVNAGALRGLGKTSGNRVPFWRSLMGWGFAARLNDPVLTEMVGARKSPDLGGQAGVRIDQLQNRRQEISQAMRAPNLSPSAADALQTELQNISREEAKLMQLGKQVKQIWNNGSHVRQGRDPYKMASRVVMLSDALGEKTLFHCKSGKDRTGQLDVEAKYLSAVFDRTGAVPPPDQQPLPATRRLRTQFALETGNHEMQRYNAGLAGFKLKHVPALDAQFERHAIPVYRGGSGFVKA